MSFVNIAMLAAFLGISSLAGAPAPSHQPMQHPVAIHPAAHTGSKATCKARSSSMYNLCMKSALTPQAKQVCKATRKKNNAMCK